MLVSAWLCLIVIAILVVDTSFTGLSLFGVGEWVGGWWCWSGSLGGMDTTSLFTAALQLPDPWRVSGVVCLFNGIVAG